jgi:hypothetical protein
MTMTAVAAVALVTFAFFLLKPPPTTPPTIAEYAPQAVKQITEAPPQQAVNGPNGKSGNGPNGTGGSGGSGNGSGGTGGGATPMPSPSGTPLPTLLHCVGDPPRQIEDPQSPPCIAYWDGSNGGATWKGVTASSITIVDPQYNAAIDKPLETFFNARFELYKRKISIVPGQASGAGPDTESADANFADTSAHAFASLETANDAGGFYYGRDLAHEGLIYATTRPIFHTADLEGLAPYVWAYPMVQDDMLRNIADWVCTRLNGHVAGKGNGLLPNGQQLNQTKRRFGMVATTEFADDPVAYQALLNELTSDCGIVIPPEAQAEETGNDQFTGNSATVLKMRNANVTSVICLCAQNVMAAMGTAATNQSYFPEWLLSSYYLCDNDDLLRPATAGIPPDQRTGLIGLAFIPRELAIPLQPARQAAVEGDPPGQYVGGYPPNSGTYYQLTYTYRSLLLIASGIQMAGPHLTPQTFADGLHRTTFPNPETRLMAGHVGFANNSYSMTVDATEFYYSNTAPSPYAEDGPGAVCYVNGGARHRGNAWPPGVETYNDPNCDSGA